MRQTLRRFLVLLLSVLLTLPDSSSFIAYALEEPMDRNDLSVPESLQDGGKWYFIRENTFTVSETSDEKLYIPIQRTGDLSTAGEVTLKLIDVTSRHDVNYKEKIYRESPESDIEIADVSLLDLAQGAEYQEEFDPVTEEELADAINAQGGADILDAEGNPVGEVTVVDQQENGEITETVTETEETAEPEETVIEEYSEPEEVSEETYVSEEEEELPVSAEPAVEEDPSAQETEWTEEELSDPDYLRKARDQYTGTVSDRQKMAGTDEIIGTDSDETSEDEEVELIEDAYPGKTYRLHFDEGEDVKYLVITPLYSDAADGDCQLMLMLKDPGAEDEQISEDFRISTVVISDEDESAPAVVSMSDELIIAEDGKASVTVTREGRINDMIGVHLTSWGGSAVMGDDYSGIGADLYFPMGITSRTVDIPVGYGEEDKDFYITLSPVTETEIDVETSRVVIPASSELMAEGTNANDSDGPRLGDPWNLRDTTFMTYYLGEYLNNGEGFKATTPIDKEHFPAGLQWHLHSGSFYDGFCVDFLSYLNFCDARAESFVRENSHMNSVSDDITKGGVNSGMKHYVYYEGSKAPDFATVQIVNYDNGGTIFNDSYARIEVYSVRPIYRQFNITVTDGRMVDGSVPDFGESTGSETAVILNDKLEDHCTIWGDETFAITQPAGQKYTRLVGIDAVNKEGRTFRLAIGNGTSQTLVAKLDEISVNALADGGYIEWTKGSADKNSKIGNITVRPVFEYLDARVEIKESQFGEFYSSIAPSPTLLWDFNSDQNMSSCMGKMDVGSVTYKAAKDDQGNDYYTFSATGNNPRVSISLGADSVDDIQWAKVRARTGSSQAEAIELYGHGGDGRVKEEECTHIDLTNDGEWHTYIINIPEENVRTANQYKKADLSETAWSSRIDWIRLDPIWNRNEKVSKGESIDIDYIAFFPSREAAEIYREESGENGYRLAPGIYNFHTGDVLTLRTELSEAGKMAGVNGDGVRYNLYTEYNGEDISRGTLAYANDSTEIKLRGAAEDESRTGVYYRLEPTFTQTGNQLIVQIDENDLAYFNTDEGVLKTENRFLEEGVWNYLVAGDVASNEVFELWAETLDSENIPVWTGAKDGTVCSGKAYYMMTGVFAEDNVVKLSVDTDADAHAYYNLNGNVFAQVMNLATNRPSDVLTPAKEALITAGLTAAVADENGDFNMPAIYLAGGTSVRYTVTYNGTVSIREAKLAPAGAKKQDARYFDPDEGEVTVQAVPVSLNTVAVESYSLQGAHFTRVDLSQSGILNGVTNMLETNGKKVTITVHVDGNRPYVFNNAQYTEHVQEVIMYFQSQITKEVHGIYSTADGEDSTGSGKLTWDADAMSATLTFDQFSPDAYDYDPGDVLMLQLVTDKKVGIAAFSDRDMTYDPVSSGIAVTADLDYEPDTIDIDMPDMASLLQVFGPNENGTGTDTGKASFGRFPFLGEINVGLKVFTAIVNRGLTPDTKKIITDLNAAADDEDPSWFSDEIDDDDEFFNGHPLDDPQQDVGLYADEHLNRNAENTGVVPQRKWGINIQMAFTTKKTYYGGVRFCIAVIASKNFGKGYKNLSTPYKNASTAWGFFTSGRYKSTAPVIPEGEQREFLDVYHDFLYNNNGFDSKGQEIRSMFGGSRFSIGLFVGLYVDFGYVVKDGEKSGSLMLMGAGGFFGGQANFSYTLYTTFFGVPIYLTPEANLEATFYLGLQSDPDLSLEQYKQTKSAIGTAIQFRTEFQGQLKAGLSIGVGIYKVLGVRLSGFLGFDAGYGEEMAKWFKQDGSAFGYTTDFTASGTIDLIITDIDLYTVSFPLPWSGGWMKTMQEVRRAKTVIDFVKIGIAEGKSSQEVRSRCQEMADALQKMIDEKWNLDPDALTDKSAELREYARNNKLITFSQYNRCFMNRQEGVIGGIIEESIHSGPDTPPSIPGTATNSGFEVNVHAREHVNSQWLGNQNSLLGTFKPADEASTAILERNSYTQTSSQILPIGNNKFLMVYLTDNNSRDRQMAAQLVYTVYDASSNQWDKPVAVQNDITADGKPHLTDAGDQIILTWSSIPDEKYLELKETVYEELKSLGEGEEPAEDDVINALEQDPARVMELMEIYTVNFDKNSMSFDSIEQLTDDRFYDDNPQAVYDAETGDYIVLYYKSAQKADEYTDSSEKLIDMVGIGSDPEKTYSLLCYMLYNNQTDARDTTGAVHEPGWARDYYFPNETTQEPEELKEFIDNFKGQRFLYSAAGKESDPPIGDLSVCIGYNGLAAYAYTVDRDYDLSTSQDKELYTQFYDFSDHSTYVPIKIAGEKTVGNETQLVDVGTPKLIRSGGSTWLFWREDGSYLRYLNISELLNAKVSAVADPGEDDWVWAVRPDGTFATDAVTGEVYTPHILSVDFGSMMTDSEFNGTEYSVITDKEDNLYVVWSNAVGYKALDPDTNEVFDQVAQEIYASAMIKEENNEGSASGNSGNASIMADSDESETTSNVSARWSKPNRLTTQNKLNDGIAVALDEDGSLIIIHNQYEHLLADTEEEVLALLEEGKLGIKEFDGVNYIVGSLWYNSPNSLAVTKCVPAGSVEATKFAFSHTHPVAGERVKVEVAVENTGMTTADAYSVEFYESKNGVRGRRITSYEKEEPLPVNYFRRCTFLWTIPEEGPDGYCIEAVITEKKADGSSYDPVSSYSDTFDEEDLYTINMDSIKQNGDVFDVTFSVTNTGNIPAAEGISAKLYLTALYGDIKELYGMDDDLLITEDITGLEPRETRTVTRSIALPVSVFEYCGYDAISAAVKDSSDVSLAISDDMMFGLEYPIHLSLNDGNDITLNQGESTDLSVGFETDAFVDVSEIIYSVDDTSVASIDENGVITALGKGITTITATLMPSGRTVTLTLTVLGENGEMPEPTVEPEPEKTPEPAVKPGQNDQAPNTSDRYPVKYLWIGGGALLAALLVLFLRLRNRK